MSQHQAFLSSTDAREARAAARSLEDIRRTARAASGGVKGVESAFDGLQRAALGFSDTIAFTDTETAIASLTAEGAQLLNMIETLSDTSASRMNESLEQIGHLAGERARSGFHTLSAEIQSTHEGLDELGAGVRSIGGIMSDAIRTTGRWALELGAVAATFATLRRAVSWTPKGVALTAGAAAVATAGNAAINIARERDRSRAAGAEAAAREYSASLLTKSPEQLFAERSAVVAELNKLKSEVENLTRSNFRNQNDSGIRRREGRIDQLSHFQRNIDAALASHTTVDILPTTGPTGATRSHPTAALQDRAATLLALYDSLRQRGEDVSAVVSEIYRLNTEVEAVIRGQGEALTQVRTQAHGIAGKLQEALTPELHVDSRFFDDLRELADEAEKILQDSSLKFDFGNPNRLAGAPAAVGLRGEPLPAGRLLNPRSSIASLEEGARRAAEEGHASGFMGASDTQQSPRGNRLFQGVDSAIGSGAERVFDGLKSGASTLLGVFNPLAIIGAVFRTAMESLTPVMEALAPPAEMLGTILGSALAPVLKGMFPIFKGLAIAATYVGQVFFNIAGGIATAIGWLVEAIGSVVGVIFRRVGRTLENIGKDLQSAGKGFFEGASAMSTARDEIRAMDWDDLGKAVGDTARTMTDLPRAVNLALYRQRYGAGVPGDPPGHNGSGGSAPGEPGYPHVPGTGSRPYVPEGASFDIHGGITIITDASESGEQVLRKVERAVQDRASRGAPTYLPGAKVTA